MGNNFKIVLEEWRRFKFPDIVPRYIEPKISKDIAAIIGPRRVGKTYLLLHLAKKILKESPKDNVVYLNFDDERIEKDFEKFFQSYYEIFSPKEEKKIVLFLDEIQLVKKWAGWLRTLHNQGKYHLFVAGSSSKLLSKEIATSLRGRYVSYLLLPFSFKEFLEIKEVELKELLPEDRGKIMKYLREYIEFGGFPEVILEKNEFEKRKKLKTLYETIFFRDIVERFKIRNYETAKNVLEILLSNYSSRVTISKLNRFLNSAGVKIAKKTLWRYVQYFEDAFSIFLLPSHTFSKRKQILLPRKIYSVDTGLSLFLSGKKDEGRLIENIVFLEILRRREKELFDVFYYLKDDFEVDFVLKQGTKVKQLIQVCYEIKDFSTREREIKALLKASGSLRCKNLLCITWDFEGVETIERK
ncbi:MAG: ATP-binding protein, partial [Candidatus Aenigmarchaeota archaeon]|nr:ATP-binding protein [Candidatus Aenigmarchaeota archaeon]